VGHLYNTKLSDAEVLQNFNSQKSRFGLWVYIKPLL
jgi:hypothetical protein